MQMPFADIIDISFTYPTKQIPSNKSHHTNPSNKSHQTNPKIQTPSKKSLGLYIYQLKRKRLSKVGQSNIICSCAYFPNVSIKNLHQFSDQHLQDNDVIPSIYGSKIDAPDVHFNKLCLFSDSRAKNFVWKFEI
jgi:hypothetical protein